MPTNYSSFAETEAPQTSHPVVPDEPQLSIVIPTFQEAPNLRSLAYGISSVLRPVLSTWEIVIIDDNSQDGSVEICRALRAEGMPIRLVIRPYARGLSSAVVEGFAHAQAPVLLVMDADLSHPASAIPLLYQTILEGADFAIGSRYVSGGSTDERWSTYRWLNSKVAAWLAKPLVPLHDPTAGFFAFSRSLLGECDSIDPIGYKIALEILVKSGATLIREVPIHFSTRQFGKSKLKLKQQFLYLCHLYSLYRFKFFQTAPRRQSAKAILSSRSAQFNNRGKVL
jgi:dolichol-phosphate mannosyltransferase